MKKIIALVIAIVMMAAISVPAFASNADVITPATAAVHTHIDEAGQGGSVVVEYALNENWSVSYPAEAAITTADTYEVSVTANQIDWDHIVKVAVAGRNNKFELANVDAALKDAPAIAYTVKNNASAITSGTVIASATPADLTTFTETTAELSFEVPTVAVAGNYADTLTFTVSVVEDTARQATQG